MSELDVFSSSQGSYVSSKLAFNLFSNFLAGDAVGYFSAPLKHIFGFQDNLDGLNWIELFSDSPAVVLIIFPS